MTRPNANPGAWGRPRTSGGSRDRGVVVGYQGAPGSNGDQAIDARWGKGVERRGYREFAHVIDAVVQGEANVAVLPVHNAVIGEIPEIGSLLQAARLRVVDHVVIDVMHCLLGVPGASLTDVAIARSHPAALLQCARFFNRHPRITALRDYDTAGAARHVAWRGIRSEAAIAPAGCAGRYGLQVLVEGIADVAANQTRFAVVVRAIG